MIVYDLGIMNRLIIYPNWQGGYVYYNFKNYHKLSQIASRPKMSPERVQNIVIKII